MNPLTNPSHPQYQAYQVAVMQDAPRQHSGQGFEGQAHPASFLPLVLMLVLVIGFFVMMVRALRSEEKARQEKIQANPSWYDAEGREIPGTPAWDELFQPLREAMERNR